MARSHGTGAFSPSELSRCGAGVVFEAGVLVFHPENIEIDDDVYVGHHAILKGYHRNKMVIGARSWIGQQCFLHSAGGITVGVRVGIGPGAKLLTSTHELPADLRRLFEPLGLGKSNGKHDDEEVTAVASGAGRGKIPGVNVRTSDEESGVIQIEYRWLEEAPGPVAAAATVDKALADLDKDNR